MLILSFWEDVKAKITELLTPKPQNCPQINVSMEDNSWQGLNIANKIYDGWTIKGKATCRKGIQEGENLNKYYCGGFTCAIGICIANVYIEKTIISETGNIEKTDRYVIFNSYDENKKNNL